MPLGVTATVEGFDAVVEAEMTELKYRIGRAAQAGLRQGREVVSAGIEPALGRRVALAWARRLYPADGQSFEVAGLLVSRAPRIHEAFSKGEVIRSSDGFFLAIPTAAAGSTRARSADGKVERLTPGGWERRTGKRLRFVYRRGAPSLLVADDVKVNGQGVARPVKARKSKSGAPVKQSGLATAIIFILVPQVTVRKLFDIDTLHAAAAEKFRAAIEAVTS